MNNNNKNSMIPLVLCFLINVIIVIKFIKDIRKKKKDKDMEKL